MSFSALKLHASLLKGVKELGFARPTPIQAEAIPLALEGRDLLACAMTGSGKTAAFLLPILNRLIDKPRGVTRALVLTPTRELAAQILEELNDLAVHTSMTGASIYGGVGMGPQEHAFRSGADVLIATPGRLLDHFRFPYAKLSGLTHLVLDEADRMLDMGFLPDIRRVLRHLPTARQTLFFSATMPGPIAALSREMLHNPATINLARQSTPAVGITHAIYPVSSQLKSSLLVTLLKRDEIREALVFTRTKYRADRLARYLYDHGVKAERIHGNRTQAHRTAALDGFKRGKYRVLVATDIAARGIDIEALGHVVNFDVPMAPDDYIHRVGRTARAELTGEAFTFVSPEEEDPLRRIEQAIGKRLPRVIVPDFDYGARAETSSSMRRGDRGDRGDRPETRRGAPRSGGRRDTQGPRQRSSESGRPSSGAQEVKPAEQSFGRSPSRRGGQSRRPGRPR